tara:strand:+ start:152 stop:325 length:174 start_codon:yes stop_codon:yes gene_type:complete
MSTIFGWVVLLDYDRFKQYGILKKIKSTNNLTLSSKIGGLLLTIALPMVSSKFSKIR